MIDNELHLSQQQQDINDHSSLLVENENNNYINVSSTDNDSEICDIVCDYKSYTEKVALIKRAQDLCLTDDEHKKFYTDLYTLVNNIETNHNDNEKALSKRKSNDSVLISSNKITNTSKRSTKRIKGIFE